jgi:hypothetical protein
LHNGLQSPGRTTASTLEKPNKIQGRKVVSAKTQDTRLYKHDKATMEATCGKERKKGGCQ